MYVYASQAAAMRLGGRWRWPAARAGPVAAAAGRCRRLAARLGCRAAAGICGDGLAKSSESLKESIVMKFHRNQ